MKEQQNKATIPAGDVLDAKTTSNIGHRWQPGESGNPAGRPIGSRHKIAEAIVKDISVAWQTHGVDVLNKIAISDPVKFAQLAAGLIPKEFQLSVETRLPGGLSPDDWQMAMAVFQAVKDALPDAGSRAPADVMEFVLAAVRAHDSKLIEQ